MKATLAIVGLAAIICAGCGKRDDSTVRQIQQLSQQVAQLQSQITTLQNKTDLLHDEVLDTISANNSLVATNFWIVCDNQGKILNAAVSTKGSLLNEIDSLKTATDLSDLKSSLTALDIKVDGLKTGQDFAHDKLDQLFDIGMETEKNVSDIAIKTHSF